MPPTGFRQLYVSFTCGPLRIFILDKFPPPSPKGILSSAVAMLTINKNSAVRHENMK